MHYLSPSSGKILTGSYKLAQTQYTLLGFIMSFDKADHVARLGISYIEFMLTLRMQYFSIKRFTD